MGGQIFAKIQALVVVEESRGGGGGSGVCGDVFASFLDFICGGGIWLWGFLGLGFGFYEVDRDGGRGGVGSDICGGVFAGFLKFVYGGGIWLLGFSGFGFWI